MTRRESEKVRKREENKRDREIERGIERQTEIVKASESSTVRECHFQIELMD